MVEAELAFLEMEQKGIGVHASESGEPGLRVAPEALDAVDVVAADASAAELVGAVIDAKVPLVAHVDQAVVARPSIGMDDAVERDFATNRLQEHGFGAIGHDLGVDLVAAIGDAKHRRVASGAATDLTPDPTQTEVALVDLDGPAERPFEFAGLAHAFAQAGEQTIDGVAVEPGKLGDLHARKIGGHMPEKPAKNAFTNPGACDRAVFDGKHSLSGGCRTRSARHDPLEIYHWWR